MTKLFGLSVYGPSEVKFTKIVDKNDKKMKLQDILYSALYHKAKSTTEEWAPLTPAGVFSKLLCKFEHSSIGYGFYCFRNQTIKNIEIRLTMKDPINVRFCKENPFIFLNLMILVKTSNGLFLGVYRLEKFLLAYFFSYLWLVFPRGENLAVTLRIDAGSSKMAIWDIYDDSSSINFKTSVNTY